MYENEQDDGGEPGAELVAAVEMDAEVRADRSEEEEGWSELMLTPPSSLELRASFSRAASESLVRRSVANAESPDVLSLPESGTRPGRGEEDQVLIDSPIDGETLGGRCWCG